MASENSIFQIIELVNFLKVEYGFDIVKVEALTRGSANIFKVCSIDGSSYIVKEFQSNFPLRRIILERQILQHLNLKEGRRLIFPVYLSNLRNQEIASYKGHWVIVQRYIDGNTLDSFCGDNEQIADSAKVYAEIVNLMMDFPIPLRTYQEKVDYSQLIDIAIGKHLELLNYLNDKVAIEEVKTKLLFLHQVQIWNLSELDLVTYANTHGDYSVFQCIYDENGKIKSVVDFLSAKRMPLILEIVRSLNP